MMRLEAAAQKLIKQAHHLGRVHIITNRSKKWLEWFLDFYFPCLNLVLESQNIKLISAREECSERWIYDAKEFKKTVFNSIAEDAITSSEIDNQGRPVAQQLTVLSIGNAHGDRDAVLSLAGNNKFPVIGIKVLKVLENPKMQELIRSHEVMIPWLRWMCFCPMTLKKAYTGSQEFPERFRTSTVLLIAITLYWFFLGLSWNIIDIRH